MAYIYIDIHIYIAVYVVTLAGSILTRLNYIYVCVCVPCVHSAGVHGRFYRLDLKEIVILENKPWGGR